jgi:flagellar protein FliO/FliZ
MRRIAAVAMCAFAGLMVVATGANAANLIAKAPEESKPLDLTSPSTGTQSGGGGASLVRTIVGLAVVIGVIWGITWVLRQVKSGRDAKAAGTGLASMATLPLGSGRSLQLVRAGSDYMLVGVAEQGVVPIFRYTESEARSAGLLGNGAANPMVADDSAATAIEMPGPRRPETPLDRLRRMTVRP